MKRVEALSLVEHTQGAHGKNLGLTALEQARTMNAGQVARLDVEGADLVGFAAVGALARLDDHAAHRVLLERLQRCSDISRPGRALFLGELLGEDARFEVVDLAHARLLVGVLKSCRHLVEEGVHALVDGRIGAMDAPLLGLDGTLVDETLLRLAELGDGGLAEGHRRKHVLFGDFLATGLDHADVLGGAGDDQIEIGVLGLFVSGVADEITRGFVAADAHARNRTLERRGSDGERSGCAGNADGVDGIYLVGNKRGGNDVHLVLKAVDEAGTNRAVDHAGGKRALLGGTRLALQVAARDTADGVHLFDVVDGQREEVVIFLFLRNDCGDKHGSVALRAQHGARRLLGKFARFEAVLLAVNLEGFDDFFHVLSFSSFQQPYCGWKLLRRRYFRFASPRQARALAPPAATAPNKRKPAGKRVS